MTPAALFSAIGEALANDAGLIFLILVILWMGARKKWYWSHTVERLETQLTDERISHMRELGELRTEVESWRRMSLMQQGQRGPEAPPRPPPNPLEGG
jgi:predicted ATPase